MNARSCRLALLWSFFALGAAPPLATAQSSPIFGLGSTTITPPSGVATAANVLTIQLGGVAGSTLVPQNISVTSQGPGVFLISLTTPGSVGATIPTPWNIQTTHGPLAAGVYDFNVRGVIGFGTPNEMVIGTELAVDNFVVVPEPAAGLLAMAMIGFGRMRRRD
jgi:hypothetical protein